MRKRLSLTVTLVMVYLTAGAMPMHADAACVNPPPGMVSWWGGDNNAQDIVGTNNGTLNGAVYALGKVGQAFSFDGIDDYLEVPNSATLDLTGGLTMAAWVNLRSLDFSTIFSKSDYNGSQSVTSYGIQVNPDGAVNAALYGTYPADNWATAAGLITPNNWFHIALTWDGTYGPSDNVRLYINGSFVQAWTKSAAPLNTTSQTLTLGSMKPSTYYGSMDGLIDEAALFSRALSATEITAIYNAGSEGMCRPCAPPPLDMVSWWPGDDNAQDVVGNNSGTLVNGATYGAGKVGRAFSFDGEDDYVSVPDSPSLDITGSISMDAWIYRNDGASEAGLLKKGPFGTNGVYSLAIYDNKFYFRLNGDNLNLPSVTSIPVGTWTHVAGTYDGTTARIYINGILDTSAPYAQPIGTDNNPLYIGLYGATTKYFPGLIDEIEIFNRVLSAEDIADIYNTGSTGKCKPQCIPPPSGLVSWWGGDNNALDMVGTNNGGLVGSASYGLGMVGQAFSFDGSANSYLEITDHPSLNPSDAFTIDGWFYIDPNATGNIGGEASLVSKGDGGVGGGGWFLWFQDSAAYTKALRFDILTWGTPSWPYAEVNNIIDTAGWYHVAGVFDLAANPQAKLYVNGTLAASSTSTITALQNNSYPVRIGASNWGSGDRFNGKADEVVFFNRALTADEVAAIYNAGSAGMSRSSSPPPAGLAAWWKAENNANDQLGVNNGALNGAAFAPGKVGQAFSFDGADDFISIPDGIVSSTARNFTVAAWVYANTIDAVGENHIVYSGPSGGGEYYLANRNGNIEFAVFLSGDDWQRIGVPADIGVWRYVTGVRRGTTIEIWVDGMLRNSMSIPDSDLVTGAAVHSSIGSYNRGGHGFWDGLIDEASVFNRALSADEIASIYNAGSAGMAPIDTTPDAFSFISQTGMPLNTTVVSSPVTVTGINFATPISITACTVAPCVYRIGGGSWTSSPGTVNNGDTVMLSLTSSASYSTQTTATLTIGGVPGPFSVTTFADLFLNPVTTPTNRVSQLTTGTVKSGATVTVSLNDGAAQLADVDGSGWSYLVTGLARGNNSITVSASDTGYSPPGKSAAINCSAPRLTVTVIGAIGSGTAGGSVTSTPSGIVCPESNCASLFDGNSPVSLLATPDGNSLFGSWGGDLTGTAMDRVIDMGEDLNADKSVTANFIYVEPARIKDGSDYPHIRDAYAALTGNGSILARQFLFTGGLILDRGYAVILKGGYDPDYIGINGYSTIEGGLTVKSGSLTVDRVAIR